MLLPEQKTRSLERIGMGNPLESDDSEKRHERGRWITALGEGRDAMLVVHSKFRDGFSLHNVPICPLPICLLFP